MQLVNEHVVALRNETSLSWDAAPFLESAGSLACISRSLNSSSLPSFKPLQLL